MRDNNISSFKWPTLSLDLNPAKRFLNDVDKDVHVMNKRPKIFRDFMTPLIPVTSIVGFFKIVSLKNSNIF